MVDADLPVPTDFSFSAPKLVGKNEVVPLATTDVLARAADYAEASAAPATRRAYASDLRDFAAWCAARATCPLPAEPLAVAAYLAALADRGLKASTISRRTAAIGYAHASANLANPANTKPVKQVLQGIRRRIGTAVQRKAPVTARTLNLLLRRVPDTLKGRRDRALLLIGFAAALRRSELVDLDVNDLTFDARGLELQIRRSKTDQEGFGDAIAIPRGKRLKPVEALEAWLAAASIAEGPVFRPIGKGDRVLPGRLTDRAVALIVKHYAKLAKLDPALFSGHSLRAGFVTSALEHGADLFKVMDITRHKRIETLRDYDRRAKAFRDHAGKGFL
jgi:site-specific recombinase XerD